MKTLKFKSLYSLEDIDLMYKACCVHGSLEDNFGVFCLGAAMALRSIFPMLQRGNDPLALMKVDFMKITPVTIALMEGLEGAKRNLDAALAAGVSNEEISETVKKIVEQVKKQRDEKLSLNKPLKGGNKNGI